MVHFVGRTITVTQRHLVNRRNGTVLESTEQHKDEDDDQHCTEYANAAMAKAVPVATDHAGKATEQSDDEDDDQDGAKRHVIFSF